MEALSNVTDIYTLLTTVGVPTGAFLLAALYIKYNNDQTAKERENMQKQAFEERTTLTSQITALSEAVNNNTASLTVLSNMIRDEYAKRGVADGK